MRVCGAARATTQRVRSLSSWCPSHNSRQRHQPTHKRLMKSAPQSMKVMEATTLNINIKESRNYEGSNHRYNIWSLSKGPRSWGPQRKSSILISSSFFSTLPNDFYGRDPDERRKYGTYQEVVEYVRTGRLKMACDLFNSLKIKERPLLPVWSILIQHLSKAGRTNEALSYFDQLKSEGVQPDKILYTNVIGMQSSAIQALQLYDEMKRGGIRPDEYVYRTLLAKVGNRPEDVDRLINEMISYGMKPDAKIFNTIINAIKDWTLVSQLWERMKAMRVAPDEVTFNLLIHLALQAGQVAEALSFFHEMTKFDLHPTATTYTPFFTYCGIHKRMDVAVPAYQEMLKGGVTPDARTYYNMTEGFAQSGMMKEAISYFNQYKKLGTADVISDEKSSPIRFYNVIIRGYIKLGDLKTALEWIHDANKIHNGTPNVLTFEELFRIHVGKLMELYPESFPPHFTIEYMYTSSQRELKRKAYGATPPEDQTVDENAPSRFDERTLPPPPYFARKYPQDLEDAKKVIKSLFQHLNMILTNKRIDEHMTRKVRIRFAIEGFSYILPPQHMIPFLDELRSYRFGVNEHVERLNLRQHIMGDVQLAPLPPVAKKSYEIIKDPRAKEFVTENQAKYKYYDTRNEQYQKQQQAQIQAQVQVPAPAPPQPQWPTMDAPQPKRASRSHPAQQKPNQQSQQQTPGRLTRDERRRQHYEQKQQQQQNQQDKDIELIISPPSPPQPQEKRQRPAKARLQIKLDDAKSGPTPPLPEKQQEARGRLQQAAERTREVLRNPNTRS